MYHLRPPTRVRSVELIKCEELKKVTDAPLRHHHLKTANIPRQGRSLHRPHPDAFQPGHDRLPAAAGEDLRRIRVLPQWRRGRDHLCLQRRRARSRSIFGKLRYRAEDYIVIPRGITYRLVPDKVEEEDYLILESTGPVRIPRRYLNHDGQIRMGSPYSERDFHGPTETLVDR